jgi:hypothetical protein
MGAIFLNSFIHFEPNAEITVCVIEQWKFNLSVALTVLA